MSDEPKPPPDPPLPPAPPPGQEEGLGYGRPPRQYTIIPGERRNPRGRPKGSRNSRTIVRKEHQRPVRFQENGRTHSLPAIEVLIRKDMNDALKGNEKAKARQLAWAMQIAAEDEAKAAIKAQRQTLAEDDAILTRYLPGAKPNSDDEDET